MLLNFIAIWIISIIISVISDRGFMLETYKIVSDYGYKSKCDNIYDLPYELIYISKKTTLTPIFNLIARMYSYAYVKRNIQAVVEELISLDIIEEMTEKEKKHYEKSPNPFRAITISINSIKKIQTIEMMIDGNFNKITYRVSDDSKKLEILEVDGPIKNLKLSKKQLEKVIFNRWMELLAIGPKLHPNKFEKMLAESDEFTLNGITTEEERDLNVTNARFYYNIEELSKLNDYYDYTLKKEEEKIKVKTHIKK